MVINAAQQTMAIVSQDVHDVLITAWLHSQFNFGRRRQDVYSLLEGDYAN